MDGTKPFWASKTIWGSIATVVVGLGVSFGLFSAEQGAAITSDFPELAVGVATTVAGLVSFYGRITAKKKTTIA